MSHRPLNLTPNIAERDNSFVLRLKNYWELFVSILVVGLLVFVGHLWPLTPPEPKSSDETEFVAEWVDFNSNDLGFGLRVPTAFVASEPVTGRTLQQIAFSENQEAADHGIAPILVVSIKEVDEGLSLLDWVRSFGIAESDMQIVTIGSRQFIKWFDSIGGGLGSTSYSTIFSDNRVININMPAPSLVGTSPSLEVITSSLKLSLSPEWKTVTLMNDEISITYPPTLVLVPNGDNRIILKDATESGSSPPDGSPTISVRVEPNPDHLSMESYYDGQHGVFVGRSSGTLAVVGF